MSTRSRSIYLKATSAVILSFLLLSSFCMPVYAGTEVEEFIPEPEVKGEFKVILFYDSAVPEFCQTMYAIRGPLTEYGVTVMTIDAVSSMNMGYFLEKIKPNAAIYVLSSNLNGVDIRHESSSWSEIADVTEAFECHHIFGIGNAESILRYTDDSRLIHIEGSDEIDLRLTTLYSLWETSEIMMEHEADSVREQGESLRDWLIADFSENINEILAKDIIPEDSTGDRIQEEPDDPRLVESWVEEEKQHDDDGNEVQTVLRMSTTSQDEDYILLQEMSPKSGVSGTIGWLLDKLLYTLVDNEFDELAIHTDAADEITLYIQGVVDTYRQDIVTWLNDTLVDYVVTMANASQAVRYMTAPQMNSFWLYTNQLMDSSFYEISSYLSSWIDMVVNSPVQTKISGLVPVFLLRLGTPLNLGSGFASFGAVIRLQLLPTFELDREPFETFMADALFGLIDLNDFSTTEEAFGVVRAFIDVIPIMNLDLAICAFLPGESSWVSSLMSMFEVYFFGHAHFQVAYPPLDQSNSPHSFIEVREWMFHFELDASFTLSLDMFLEPFGSAVSSVISTILDVLSSLLSMSITLTFSVLFEIGKKYLGQGIPSESTMLLEIVIGVTLTIRLLFVIFKGTLSVGMGFQQKSGGAPSTFMLAMIGDDPFITSMLPATTLTIYLVLHLSFYLGIDFIGWSTGHTFGPWTTVLDLSASWGSTDYGSRSADLTDTDGDGLPDEFETRLSSLYSSMPEVMLASDTTTFLDHTTADTDADGLNDFWELQLNTMPNIMDTDDDLLTDGEEVLTYGTDPLLNDTDRDELLDGVEVLTYGTSPFLPDTDADGLWDIFEIETTYDLTYTAGTFGAVESVVIGGVTYNDRTDPLNPDTDNDFLLDGQEWNNSIRYLNDTELLLYENANLGYTHPLDADTDDDSVLWHYTGSGFVPSEDFIWDMRDGIEVKGQWAIITDIDGFPEPKYIKTNPCNPDTDNDTGPALYNTDAYELALPEPTDPTNGDTDSDGILDGYEKIGPLHSGTNPLNPDTDNDNLPDFEDWMLPTDPRDPDTDDDLVLDGDEYFLYGTDPVRNDTDFDGLLDGEELFYFYCNPNVRDSDGDGLTDGEEVLIYDTDPLLLDTDDDGLGDGYEVTVSHTDPKDPDSDDDGLTDGEELLIYNSNPLDWDTDDDSLWYPLANGSMTLPWGDGDEVARGTDPTAIDTDSDGITDAQEIYMAMGGPNHSPVPLDPLDPDTDDDLLLDGEEMVIKNISLITFPYEGLDFELRYGSCPVLNDTDYDGVDDWTEVMNMTDPADADTDDDLLSDYEEMYCTGTNPNSNDTDNDGIADTYEALNWTCPEAYVAAGSFILSQEVPLYDTSALDSDSDDDLLPDGVELWYGTNPLNPDVNENGVLDGYEYDTDGDGLSDGEELYIYGTQFVPIPYANGSLYADPGGFLNPDSDLDGLTDGEEVHVYGTDPTSADTDGDGVSDYDEVAMGMDPIVPVTEGWPMWMLLAVGAAAGVAGLVVIEGMYFLLRGRVSRPRRGKAAPKKKAAKKPAAKTKKSEKTTKPKKSTKSTKKEGDEK